MGRGGLVGWGGASEARQREQCGDIKQGYFDHALLSPLLQVHNIITRGYSSLLSHTISRNKGAARVVVFPCEPPCFNDLIVERNSG